MNMIIHIYFALGKIIYSVIGRRERKFLFYESIGCFFVLVIAFLVETLFLAFLFIPPKGALFENINHYSFVVGIGVLYAIAYICTALISRYIVPSNPIELSTKSDITFFSISAIDACWITIIGFTYGGIIVCRIFPTIASPLFPMSVEAYKLFFEELKFLFSRTIDMGTVLGTVLVAALAIQWAGEFWRKRTDTAGIDYKKTTIVTCQMVFAYFLIITATVLWIALPLYEKRGTLGDVLGTLGDVLD